MARALQCDNCKKYFGYKRPKSSLDIKVSESNTIAFCFSNDNGLQHIESFDVCPECLNRLFSAVPGFIGGEKK